MGDSRILFTIILRDQSQLTENRLRKSLSLSADSTLSEAISRIKSVIDDTPSAQTNAHKYKFGGSDESNGGNGGKDEIIQLSVYDCTTYPPKDITPFVNQYTNVVGPKSITLQRLGWFPSANVCICQSADEKSISSILNSDIHSLDDFEYNNPNLESDNHLEKTPQVLLKGDLAAAATVATKPLPSDLFKVVQTRFDDDSKASSNNNDHKKKRRTETERRALLDRRLEQLDQKMSKSKKNKNKKVSDQVKKMLIKSRAVGNKRVSQCDRFYLDVVLWDDTSDSGNSNSKKSDDDALENENMDVEQFMSSSYMFHSRVATVGKVISAAVGSKADSRNKGAELLVLTSSSPSDSISMVYRRLPPTLPLHEAESKGFFSNFGRVVVRIFQAEGASVSNCYSQSIEL